MTNLAPTLTTLLVIGLCMVSAFFILKQNEETTKEVTQLAYPDSCSIYSKVWCNPVFSFIGFVVCLALLIGLCGGFIYERSKSQQTRTKSDKK